MRRYLIVPLAFLLVASLSAQDYFVPSNTRTSASGIEIPEAPIFGTPSYFRQHFDFFSSMPSIELEAPARLAEFVNDGSLELSLDDYLQLVMQNNTDIQIQKLSLESPKNAIASALARFDPTATMSFRSNRSTRPSTSQLEGAAVSSSLSQPSSLNYSQTLDTGTSYSVGFSGSRSASNSSFSTVNPSINTGLDFSITQPLIRNLGREITRINVTLAESRYRVSHNNLEETLLRLISSAETAYWNVIDARENLRVAQQALELAQAFLQRSERELELGAISELDIYQPQQNVANREISVTQSQNNYEQALDNLRQQMGADLDPTYRSMPIELTEPVNPPDDVEPIDREAMVQMALQRRPNLRNTQESLFQDDLNYKSARNALRPDLSLGLSYSSSGVGGNEYKNGVLVMPGGLGDALNQLWAFDYPTYGFSLTLRLPIRDRSATIGLANSLVAKKQDLLQARSTEQSIRLEVLNAVTQAESSRERVRQSGIALDFSQKRLDGEQQKYDLGVTDIFVLLDAQNALANSQADLVTQAASYRRAMTNLLRVTGQLLEERNIVVP